MEWFNGTVDEALKLYQEKNGILIVYIFDSNLIDANTANFNHLWDAFDKAILDSIPYVSLKLEKSSSGATQFSEFFPTPVFPVCYIIGLNAFPLEVVTTVEELTVERLNNSLLKSVELYKAQLAENTVKLSPSGGAQTTEESGSTDAETKSKSQSPPVDGTSSISLDDKVNLARKLLEEKRAKDEEKKKAEEREKELHRRNEGKMLTELMEKNKNRELQEMVEARQRQKKEDDMALKRLRDQIKHDKEERAQKSKGIVNEPVKVKVQNEVEKPAVSNLAAKCTECRIQCKFPDGSTLSRNFPPNAQLQAVMDVINEDPRKPDSYMLVQAYPRRPLDTPCKTLEELSLVPSSSLLIVPAFSNSNTKRSLLPQNNYLQLFLGILYSPLNAMFSLVWRIFGLNGPENPRQVANQSKQTSQNDATTTSSQKEKNVNRLKVDGDSSDEGATYNGNSTQQL